MERASKIMPVAVVIPTTKKNKKSFEAIVVSLGRQTILPARLVVICDDACRPEKLCFETCPMPISWIENKEKISLTRRLNQAIDLVKEDVVLFLNDDMKLSDNFIEQLFLAMEQDPLIGIVTGKILRMDKKTLDTAGLFLGKERKPHDRGYNESDQGQFERSEYVFGACGAAMLCRREMLEEIEIFPGEYFDSDYNMFYEDLDVSWRAHNFGWKAYYTHKAVAYHSRGATAKELKPALDYFSVYNFAWLRTSLKSDLIKNRLMTIIKNDRLFSFLRDLPYILAYDFKLFFYCLIFDPLVIGKTFFNLPLIFGAFRKRKLLKRRLVKR